MGVFSFEFDAGLLGLLGSCRALYRSVSNHPIWITGILGLSPKHVGAVLGCPSLTCAGVARHICLNAARLPDVIRKHPKFRQILRPSTRHSINKKQEAVEEWGAADIPPKLRSIQLLGTFLLGEPAYRGDADADPVTGELLALCKKIAKDDPI